MLREKVENLRKYRTEKKIKKIKKLPRSRKYFYRIIFLFIFLFLLNTHIQKIQSLSRRIIFFSTSLIDSKITYVKIYVMVIIINNLTYIFMYVIYIRF